MRPQNDEGLAQKHDINSKWQRVDFLYCQNVTVASDFLPGK